VICKLEGISKEAVLAQNKFLSRHLAAEKIKNFNGDIRGTVDLETRCLTNVSLQPDR